MNLPTGCRISDLPGFTDLDIAWDRFLEVASEDISDADLDREFEAWIAEQDQHDDEDREFWERELPGDC